MEDFCSSTSKYVRVALRSSIFSQSSMVDGIWMKDMIRAWNGRWWNDDPLYSARNPHNIGKHHFKTAENEKTGETRTVPGQARTVPHVTRTVLPVTRTVSAFFLNFLTLWPQTRPVLILGAPVSLLFRAQEYFGPSFGPWAIQHLTSWSFKLITWMYTCFLGSVYIGSSQIPYKTHQTPNQG